MFTRINQKRVRHSRGTVLLEFGLIAVFMLMLLGILVDVGRVMLVINSAQDSAFTSARAGAQVGYWGSLDPTEGPSVVAAQESFDESMLQQRGGWGSVFTLEIEPCSPSNDFNFTTKVSGKVDLIFANWSSGLSDSLGQFTVETSGVSRCEIVRS